MRFAIPLFLSVTIIIPLVGCGSDGRKPVYPTKGRVAFKGQPTPHAQVSLHPVGSADKDAPHPTGKVLDDGTFLLTSYHGNDGAPAGEYTVTVQWWLSTAKKGSREGDGETINRLPARYGRPETSGLKVRIEPGDNELPVIKLTQ